jgi:predicted acyltransferase
MASCPEKFVSQAEPAGTSSRLVSLDALRGFDMFWIVAAEQIVEGLHELSSNPTVEFLKTQLTHVEWEGLVFYDLIFPLFVFIAGVSIPLSIGRRVERGEPRGAIAGHLFRRAAILFVLGIIYNGGMSAGWSDIRVWSVLGRIALSSLGAGLIYLYFRPRGQLAWFFALLVGYWAALTFIPVPGYGAGDYSPLGNLTRYVDQVVPIGRMHFKEWGFDPEGLLSAFPAVGSCLLGVFCGQILQRADWSNARKALLIAALGGACLATGFGWGMSFPIVKSIWTSSFVLAAGGYACLMLAAFYVVIDIWQFRAWAFPFIVIGANPLFIYLANEFISFRSLADRLVGGGVADALGSSAMLVNALVQFALQFALLYWLYRRKIHIRI